MTNGVCHEFALVRVTRKMWYAAKVTKIRNMDMQYDNRTSISALLIWFSYKTGVSGIRIRYAYLTYILCMHMQNVHLEDTDIGFHLKAMTSQHIFTFLTGRPEFSISTNLCSKHLEFHMCNI